MVAPVLHPEFLVRNARTRYHTGDEARTLAQKRIGEGLTLAARFFGDLAPKRCRTPKVDAIDLLPVVYHGDGVGYIVAEIQTAGGGTKATIPVEALGGMRERTVLVGHPAYRPETGKLRLEIVVTIEWETAAGEQKQAMFAYPANFRKAIESGEWRMAIELRPGQKLTPKEEHNLFNGVLLRRTAGVVFTRSRDVRGKTPRWRFEGFVCDGKVGDDGRFGRLVGTPVVWDAESADAAPLNEPQYVRFDVRLDHLLVREHLGPFTGYNVAPPAAEGKTVAVEEDEVADTHGVVHNIFNVLAPFGIESEDDVIPSKVAAAKSAFREDFNPRKDGLAQAMLKVYRKEFSGLSSFALFGKVTKPARSELFQDALAKAEANFLKEEPPTPPEDERPASEPARGDRASVPLTEDATAPAGAEPASQPAGETPPTPAAEETSSTAS